MKIVSTAEMKAIEAQADAHGLTYLQMMENAGRALAERVLRFDSGWSEALGLVGSGNNGGDTLVALTHLARAGWRTRAYCAYYARRKLNDELIQNLIQAGGEIISSEADDNFYSLSAFVGSANILLDGLLGTGAKLPLKPEMARVLAALKVIDSKIFVLAVDCPSGVDCDSGATAPDCLRADLTLCMAAIKQGLLKLPSFEFVGDIEIADIGLPIDLPLWTQITRFAPHREWVARHLPPRPLDAHKGTFGTALIIAGSLQYSGAALLAATAAYRVGAGLVTLAAPVPLHAALAAHLPEATWLTLPHENGFVERAAAILVAQNLQRVTSMLIGPGLGTKETTRDFFAKLLELKLPPLVVDADGLRLLAQIPDWHKKLPPLSILTPHAGEMSALTGLSKDEIQNDREAIAKKFSAQWGHVVVLKGAFTVIAAPDGRIAILPVATPALARAGTGDVLAGLIVGLRAQGLDAFESAVAGAWIHARAGLAALGAVGSAASVLAGDVLACVQKIMAKLNNYAPLIVASY